MMLEFVQNLLSWLFSHMLLIAWIGLLGSLFFATVHLLTMLVTSWGDRKASSKSLICSLLLHLCFAQGIVFVNPPDATSDESKPKSDPDAATRIRSVNFEAEKQRDLQDIGNTPVWDKPPETVEMELVRLEHMPQELQPTVSPERTPEKQFLPDLNLPEVSSTPDRPVAMPKPENRGAKGPVIEVAKLMKVEEPTAEARLEVIIPSPNRSRQEQSRIPSTEDTQPTTRPTRGDIDRIRPELDSPVLLASVDADLDPRSLLKRGPIADSIERRIGPAPTGALSNAIGEAVEDSPSGPSDGGGNSSPARTRLAIRSPTSVRDGTVERFRPDRRARTPRPDQEPAVNVRIGTSVSIPRAGAVPNVQRPNFNADRIGPRVSLPSTYQGRDRSQRSKIVLKAGGTESSERAVELSLRWLAAHQTAEGYWDADRYGSGQVKFAKIDGREVDRKNAGKNADAGITGLAALAFLAAGYTHEEGEYAGNVERALLWLVRQQAEDGYLGGQASHYAKHYCHAMATYAMAEAYALQSDLTTDLRLREPIRRAVGYIISTQNPKDGGWRYLKGQISDMSMFGWQLMALKSAELAGIAVPSDTKQQMVTFLKARSLGQNEGLAGYREGEAPSPTMTAEALFCKQMLGLRRENRASTEAASYLLQNLPRRSRWNLYYWYYGNLSMIQYSGKAWRVWNSAVRDVLVAEQVTKGPDIGSWDPRGPWGPYGGRVYSTAMAALCLEVYARYLPLYQIGDRDATTTRR
jgi:hypothetical protein